MLKVDLRILLIQYCIAIWSLMYLRIIVIWSCACLMLMRYSGLQLLLLNWAISLSSHSWRVILILQVCLVRLHKYDALLLRWLLLIFTQHFFKVFSYSFCWLLALPTRAALLTLLARIDLWGSLGSVWLPVFFVLLLRQRRGRYNNHHWLNLLMFRAHVDRLIRLRRRLRGLIKEQLSFRSFVCRLGTIYYILGCASVHTWLRTWGFHGHGSLLGLLV